MVKNSNTIATIGHSTRSTGEFIDLLRQNEIERVIDVRYIPRSRHNPQFNNDRLEASLADAGIAYTHLAGLGGLRPTRRDSPNQGWKNPSFRGYADYMQTAEFTANMEKLIELARIDSCVLMCAEAVPWRCHRSLIADALLVRGWQVDDILDKSHRRAHFLTSFAYVEGASILYPPGPAKSP